MTRTVFYRSSPKTKRSLRKTCLHLGIALLLFYLGSRYYTRLYTWFISLFGMARPVAGTLAYEVRDLIVYSLRLLTPCLYLFFFLPGPDPIGPAFKRPKGHIFGVSIAVYAVASEIGSLLIQLVSTVADRFGFAVYSPSSATPTHPVAIALYLVNLAVLPAFWEELLFRGYVLGALKRYGNFFALITSSLLFALLHGNPYQAVNAFMLGLAMGVFCPAGGLHLPWHGGTFHQQFYGGCLFPPARYRPGAPGRYHLYRRLCPGAWRFVPPLLLPVGQGAGTAAAGNGPLPCSRGTEGLDLSFKCYTACRHSGLSVPYFSVFYTKIKR